MKAKGKKTFRKIAKRGRKVRSKISGGKNLPTLADFKKKVPKGGLLNPGLRKGGGLGSNVTKIKPMSRPKGNFKNILGK